MADYKMLVKGHFSGGIPWSLALNITSNQTPAALLSTCQAAVTSMWTDGTHGLQSQYVASTVVDEVDVITLSGTFKYVTKVTGALNLAGTSSDNAPSNTSTITIEKQSTGLARYQRGFVHLPAPVEGTVVGGFYTTATIDRYRDAFAALRAAINADGSTIFVHLGKNAAKDGTPAYTKTVITGSRVSNKPGQVRARMRRVRPVYA